jgi:putative transposase
MKAAGLQGRHPKAWKRTTVHGDKPVPAPDLIGRAFTAGRPNEKWCGSGSRGIAAPGSPRSRGRS